MAHLAARQPQLDDILTGPGTGTDVAEALGVQHWLTSHPPWAARHRPSLNFLPLALALACNGTQAAPRPIQAPPPETEFEAPAREQNPATIGPTLAPCEPNCSPPISQEPSAPTPPPDHSAESPLPEACAGGPEPSLVAFDAEDGIGDIALSSTHVYWSTIDAIHRRAKDGGSPEVVASVEGGAGPLRVAGSTLYWVGSGMEIFALPIDGSAQPTRLVDDLAAPLAWTADEDRLYYMAQTRADANGGDDDFCTLGYQLKSVPSTGGESEVLAEHQRTIDQLAVDATGVYWAEELECLPPEGKIAKYSFAARSVSAFAVATGIPHSLRAAGGRVLWLDEGGLWSSPAQTGEPALLAHPPTVRALATDGAAAYWAASDPDDTGGGAYSAYADVFTAPLAGGEARKIACQIYGIDEFWFAADRRAVYYRSWIHDLIGRLPISVEAALEP